MHRFSNTLRITSTALAISLLAGCAATGVAVSKRELDVQARTSTAIFVDAVAREKRTVFVDIRSGVMEFDRRVFSTFVKEQFAQNENGYRIVDDPDKAQYQMQVYVLNLEKTSSTAAEAALKQGYVGDAGAVAIGTIAGGAIAQNSGKSVLGGAVGGGLVAGAVSFIANAAVKDVTYVLVADVRIQEKTAKDVVVRKDTQISTKVSDAGTSTQRVSEARDRKEYTTRIVTTANKANLKLEQAQDLMFKKTAYAMSGFF